MFAYGLKAEKKQTQFLKKSIDWYQAIKVHSMDTYPYLTELPSKFDIAQIIQNCIHCTVLNIQEICENVIDYKLWEIDTNDGSYLFAYYFDIINTTNIWNPYSTEEYVLTKGERIHTMESIANDRKLPVIYKNTAYGYVVYNGSLYDVFSEKKHLADVSLVSDKDEAATLDLKFTELLVLLESPLMSEYKVLPLINYIRNIKTAFKPEKTLVTNIPFTSIYSLYYDTKNNFKIMSYDKVGLKYKHLRNASRNVVHISVAFDYASLTLEQLWSIYYELYTYVEKLLVYSNESKAGLIDTIYQKC